MHTTDQLNLSLAGRYVIDRLIGEGGMATVYLARDVKHQRRVALKVLKPDLGAVLGVERFLSEIQVTANLQHPNLLPLFDSGAADSLLFYVMPYVEGESLRHRIDREKQLPIDEAVRIATAIGSALDYAHRRGVIHRDLKPENILLHEGQPQVADFGIALAVSNAGGNRITQTGLSLGTPQYMSPEQATGDRGIDGRTDIYSLGALTYEMLTGEPPHTGATSQAIIARLLTEKPREIRVTRPNVSENIEAAVERALEKIPADRWETAKEFGEALAGTRIATRRAVSMQFAERGAAAQVAGVNPQPYDGRTATVANRTSISAREMVAWIVGALGAAALAFSLLRTAPREPQGVFTEFDVLLPDSLFVANNQGAASMALSRDGSTLVFTAMRPRGVAALYVRNMGERVVRMVSGTDSAGSPAISPDGSEIMFTRTGGGPFFRIATRGGIARSFADSSAGNTPPSWGDANQIVVAFRNRIWTVPVAGGVRTLLAEPDIARRHRGYGFPDILPEGRAALLAIARGGTGLDSSIIGVVTIPEGDVTELGIHGASPRYTEAGGGHIVYATADGMLFAVPFDAAKRRVTGVPFVLAEGIRVGSGGGAGFAVALNGMVVYIGGERISDTRALVAVTRSGTRRTLGLPLGHYGHPRVSPSGREIALTVGAQPASMDIWRFDIGSFALSRVTTDSSSLRPSWSPEGDHIAFHTAFGDTVVRWRPLRASGQVAPLVKSTGRLIFDFSFGPAHGYAAMVVRPEAGATQPDIWLAHIDSLDKAKPFLTEPYAEYAPRISPDGKLIAYVTTRTGRDEVYVQSIAGGSDEVRISVDGGTEPVWAPSGSELFYRGPPYMMATQLARIPRLSVTRRDTLFRDFFARWGPSLYRYANYDVLPGGRELVMVAVPPRDSTVYPPVAMVNWHLAKKVKDR